jgi:hypothetical protein
MLRIAGFTAATLYAAIGSIISAEIFWNADIFGQREHLLVILVLPYVLSAVWSDKTKRHFIELCLIGAIAGIAICFKPQQLLILIGLELFLALSNRTLRRLASPDLICAALAIVVYVAAVGLAAPLYFSKIIPLLRETYWAYGSRSLASLIRAKARLNILLLVAIAVFAWRRHELRFGIASGAFLICSTASSVAYYLQHTGWSYQAVPFCIFLVLAVFSITVDLLSPTLFLAWKFDSTLAVSTSVFLLTLLPLLIIFGRSRAEPCRANELCPAGILKSYPPKTAVLVLSTSVADAFPAVLQRHLVWASRFPCLWMLPAIIQNEAAEHGGPIPKRVLSPERVSVLAAMQRTDTAGDLRKWRPAVVVVRKCTKRQPCQALEGLNFDTLAWFVQNPGFAVEWSHYRLLATRDDLDVYNRVR